MIDRDLVFAESWQHDDQIQEWRHKSIKCAEVLIPWNISRKYIKGIYVSCKASLAKVEAIADSLSISTNRHLFFQN